MTEKEAIELARKVLAPYRRGNHVSSGVADITAAVADAIRSAANLQLSK
jgi:hypothetical protein